MIKIIMGLQGHGKTKQIIELANRATENESNCVVCIERGSKLTYDISHKIRLVDISSYPITSFERLKAFLCGLYSGNFDISDVFIDSLFKVVQSESIEETENFLIWLDDFGKTNSINFTITISADESLATDLIRKYF